MTKCKKCTATTLEGKRCKKRAACRSGSKSRCETHIGVNTSGRRRSTSRGSRGCRRRSRRSSWSDSDDSEYDSDYDYDYEERGRYGRRSDAQNWPTSKEFGSFPEGGKFPARPAILGERPSYLRNGDERIYKNVQCNAIGDTYGQDACRFFEKCDKNCNTKRHYEKSANVQKLAPFENDPLAEYYKE